MFKQKLHPDEELLAIYHRHEVTLVPKILETFVLLFVPWYFGVQYGFIFSSALHEKIFLVWTLLVALFALNTFISWSLNSYVITSKRLIHTAHSSIFKKNQTETPLERILNVSFKTTGFFSTIFRFGDVLVQVVGLNEPIALADVPHPSEVKDFLWKIHLEHAGKDFELIQDQMKNDYE